MEIWLWKWFDYAKSGILNALNYDFCDKWCIFEMFIELVQHVLMINRLWKDIDSLTRCIYREYWSVWKVIFRALNIFGVFERHKIVLRTCKVCLIGNHVGTRTSVLLSFMTRRFWSLVFGYSIIHLMLILVILRFWNMLMLYGNIGHFHIAFMLMFLYMYASCFSFSFYLLSHFLIYWVYDYEISCFKLVSTCQICLYNFGIVFDILRNVYEHYCMTFKCWFFTLLSLHLEIGRRKLFEHAFSCASLETWL